MRVDTSRELRLAYFVTPHGFGHAARAAAVMSALSNQCPWIKLDIFTQVPEWFFLDSISGPFGYHPLLTDIGLVQDSALEENVGQTCDRLDRFLPFSEEILRSTAARLSHLGCSLVVCDIAPMGICVAREAGVPSVLIENFTWDWIYDGYVSDASRMAGHAAYLRKVFESADYLVQTTPVCSPRSADLTTPPVARRPRVEPAETLRQLSLPVDARVVLITMGGVPWQHSFLDRLAAFDDVDFVIPGAVPMGESSIGSLPANVRLLSPQSGFFHPDLISASKVVIGKAGYSTVAEVYRAGVPFGYVSRARFREAAVLESFLEQAVPSLRLSYTEFADGSWLEFLPQLLAMPKKHHHGPDGAAVVAEFLLGLCAA